MRMKMCTEEKQKWTNAVCVSFVARPSHRILPSLLPARVLIPPLLPPSHCLPTAPPTAPTGLKKTLREKVDGGDEMAVVSGAVPNTGGELSYN